MSKKIVVKVELNCKKCKRRAMQTIAGIEGVDSIEVDEKNSQITVIGDPDPVNLVDCLRKCGFAELVSVGPAKKPEKKPDKVDRTPSTACVVLQPSPCDPCPRYTYYCSHEDPNACCIV